MVQIYTNQVLEKNTTIACSLHLGLPPLPISHPPWTGPAPAGQQALSRPASGPHQHGGLCEAAACVCCPRSSLPGPSAGFLVGISGLTAARCPGSHITRTRAWIQKEMLSCLFIRGVVEARKEAELLIFQQKHCFQPVVCPALGQACSGMWGRDRGTR